MSASPLQENRRAILVILDGVGIGNAPDAKAWGDEDANTLLHVAEVSGPLRAPNLTRLGLGNVLACPGVAPVTSPEFAFGRMREQAMGKDTTAGHWEISGVTLKEPFPVFPDGFPPEIMLPFEERIGRGSLANIATSGTVVLDEFGEEHVRSRKPIVYTSADSVFQVAAHEDVIPVEELYEECEIARAILQGEYAVARVIARPFVGEPGSWKRTANRRDFSLPPFEKNVFESIEEAGWPVHGIGKIQDIFMGRGIGRSTKAGTNEEGIEVLLDLLDKRDPGVLFVNLNDFDSKWGHRNDPESFARGIERFDHAIPLILERLSDQDLMIITADHGNDPTTPGTDHSRELVPLLVTGPGFEPHPGSAPHLGSEPHDLGTRDTFADAGQTIAHHFGVRHDGPGVSMQSESAD